MNTNKKYWKGLEELNETPEFLANQGREFAEDLPVDDSSSSTSNRRDFLKTMGFGLGAVTLAACNRAPVHKSIPYLIKPEEITPGVANYYATTYNGYGVLVKTREGRPIKIEGNPNSPFTKGGVCASGHASVLDLYDSGRLQGPMLNGAATSWEEADTMLMQELGAVAAAGKNIRILSGTVLSPSTQAIIDEFTAKYPTTKHVVYDTLSASAIVNANKNSFDKAVLPSYKFDKAELIVSFGADFLGTWIAPVEFTKGYVSNRNAAALKERKTMSRHIQFESGLSITGSNADKRVAIKPSQEGLAVLALYNKLASMAGVATFNAAMPEGKEKAIEETAKELMAAKGKALVVCGSNDVSVQVVVNAINSLLGSYGTTIDLDNVSFERQGNDAEVMELVKEMNNGQVDALFVYGVNPSYSLANAKEFNEGLKKVKLTVSFNDRMDETTSLCKLALPDHHYLESWGDAMPKSGTYMMIQPAINPVYNTRQAQENFLKLAGNTADYVSYLKNYWQLAVYPKAAEGLSFTAFWDKALSQGHVSIPTATAQSYSFAKDLNAVVETIVRANKEPKRLTELTLFARIGMEDGRSANNPWLLEMPDPISKVSWDNFVAVSKKQADELGVTDNDVVEIKSNGYSVKLPVVVQPGQAYGTIAIPVGYGRTAAGKAGNGVGQNAWPFLNSVNGTYQTTALVEVNKTDETYELARTQTHGSIEGRDIVRETTLAEYKEDPYARSGSHEKIHMYDLWTPHNKSGHHWGMAIDLNACTGCGACIISCSAENNVAVVGRDEVRRRREMHWIRIDRYYSFNTSEDVLTKENDYNHLEDFEDVSVIHQPMMCQHCDHATCETVCPVLATMHSSEGLNQMVYNRCFGTRYCANNCAYKVRRFNWFNYADNEQFDYHMNDEMGKMVLNPDVTVRTRGVMEKCSFCVQRIQAGKLEAKMGKHELQDGAIQTACSSSCPADAIVFGDINDPNSRVSQLLANERVFYALEELNVQPGIGYLTVVRNAEKHATKNAEQEHAGAAEHHEG